VCEDPHNFIDEIKKILEVMQVAGTDSVELASYQLKDMAHIWFTQGKRTKTECRNAMLLGDMDISRLMTHAHQVEGDKLKELAKDNKRWHSWTPSTDRRWTHGPSCSEALSGRLDLRTQSTDRRLIDGPSVPSVSHSDSS
ncbi:hypothetical protein MTR67_023134, partial [Solanum verrucosum]